MEPIYIIKATGERVPFDEGKVRSSIKRAGIPGIMENEVVAHVKDKLYKEMPTSEIYRHIIEFLGASPRPYMRSRYSLKQAIMDLGPTGFPFEKYIAAILQENGYDTMIDVNLRGLCVMHEVDILAKKDNQNTMIECKFHNKTGTRSDVKTALYVYARFQDLVTGWIDRDNATPLRNVWLVTNTKATVDAIAYANCVGIHVVSWGYPEKGNLQQMIEEKKLHPVTVLNTLSNYHKKILLANNMVLCRTLLNNPLAIELLKLKQEEKNRLLTEIESL